MWWGHIAGVFWATAFHAAASVLNTEKGSSASQVLQRLGFNAVWTQHDRDSALQGFVDDIVKVHFSLPRAPPPEMPESSKKLGLTQQIITTDVD